MSPREERILWFAAGAVIGVAAATLLAPTSGPELRGMIGDRAGEGKDRLLSQGRDLMSKGKELFDQGRRIAEDAADMFDEGRAILNRESIPDEG